MASADLYLEAVDFLRYLKRTDCGECGIESCEEFVDALKKGKKKPQDCPYLTKNKAHAFEIALKAKDVLPDVPLLTVPRPGPVGLVELNNPGLESIVLLSGNNDYTEQVILTILGTTTGAFFVLFIDTNGDTVDMAMIYQSLTAERINNALKILVIEKRVSEREWIIPGFASTLKYDIEKLTGWQITTGPVYAAELPLFLSEIWTPPEQIA